jgi:hypothetical protein
MTNTHKIIIGIIAAIIAVVLYLYIPGALSVIFVVVLAAAIIFAGRQLYKEFIQKK